MAYKNEREGDKIFPDEIKRRRVEENQKERIQGEEMGPEASAQGPEAKVPLKFTDRPGEPGEEELRDSREGGERDRRP